MLTEIVDDDLVVYDLETDEAHLLNAPVAQVWRLADGRTVDAIIDAVGDDRARAEASVWESLAVLKGARLLEGELSVPNAGFDRRSFLRRAGLAAVALPVITSILVPSPAAAATCAGACTVRAECGTGCVCGSALTCIACTPAGTGAANKPNGQNCTALLAAQYCCSSVCSGNFCG